MEGAGAARGMTGDVGGDRSIDGGVVVSAGAALSVRDLSRGIVSRRAQSCRYASWGSR
jgi:hypothetical protein